MRFLIAASPDPTAPKNEQPAMPDEKLLEAYMKFNEEMHKAGILVASEGVNPAGKGARVGVAKGKRKVIDGPFPESKELVGGFYLVDVKSLEEAISWAMRAPTGLGFDDLLTILPMTNEEDLPPEMLALIRRVAPAWSQTFRR
ncbi:MAG: YciI family protein [Thermoanaerobaculia bacterium]